MKTPSARILGSAALAAGVLFAASSAFAQTIVTINAAAGTTDVRNAGADVVSNVFDGDNSISTNVLWAASADTSTIARVGGASSNQARSAAVFVFDLTSFSSSLPQGAVITSATLKLRLNSAGTSGAPMDLYGLTGYAGSAVTKEMAYIGANDTTNATKLIDNAFATSTSFATNTTYNLTATTSFADYITSVAGTASKIAFLRLNYDANVTNSVDFATDSHGTAANRPILEITYTAIPEPSSYAAFAGLAMLGLAASRRRRSA